MLFKNSISWMTAAGLVTTALALPVVSIAGTVTVDRVSDTIATPVGKPGISYVTNSDGTSTLSVYTAGYVFCGNTGTPDSDRSTILQMKHQMVDTGSTPVHEWALPAVKDVDSVSYRGSSLLINASVDTTLTCLGTANDGAIPTALADGVFDNGLDSKAETNYRHLLNFTAPPGFDFADPDFSQVPTDPCADLAGQPPLFVENVACAAVTGATLGVGGGDVRASKLWTSTDGTSFVYVVRVDGHFGQAAQTPAVVRQPTPHDANVPQGGAAELLYVQDAFDSTYLNGAANAGRYCTLARLPTTLNTSVCDNQAVTPLQDGTLNAVFSVDGDSAAFYLAVIRPVILTHHDLTKPVVAVSASFDRAVSLEGGDNFIGDNIVFGFMPGSSGFPWMSGGQ